MQDFEKLGTFYLGKKYNLEAGERSEELILYDSKDLTTHAVVVGMTGSGKTGLCLDLLEEAAMDRIPAIVIDPKGDISNLLLTFPDLKPSDFRPWVDESQAMRTGMTADEFAAKEAQKWTQGLASWGQDGERIRTMRDRVDLQVYTPGSNSGRPLTILKSFDAPDAKVVEDSDALQERITSAVSGLLALLGIDADPIRSREHILISNILNDAWSKGRDLDLGQLIGEIQKPPFQRVGIMDLDSFFPARNRTELAMTMNNLLASPSFASWMSGESLDVQRLLHGEDGKPRISILSIAHLNDAERMFFVTILLNEVLSWMRTQAGTSSLRAILYMDEVFGYFPPTANPPSKQPMLTLLKQARAFGLGVVLATQNPVDLDYKGLSNTGTWFLGRLQTERDKARVIEGLEGAAANTGTNFDRGRMEEILAGLGSRRFLMNNVHEDEPVVFETRWAMSYLRGPLTREQLQRLVGPQLAVEKESEPKPKPDAPTKIEPEQQQSTIEAAQLIPADIPQRFIAAKQPLPKGQKLVYRPALSADCRLHFVRASYKIDDWQDKMFLVDTATRIENDPWKAATASSSQLVSVAEPVDGSTMAMAPEEMGQTRNYSKWEKQLVAHAYRNERTTVYKCTALKAYSNFLESKGDFKVRLEQAASETRDRETEKLRKKFATKYDTLRGRIKKAEEKIETERSQYKQKRFESVLSVGSSIMGALLGRKAVSATNVRRASTGARSVGRASKEKDDIAKAEARLEELQEQWKALEQDFNEEMENIADKMDVEKLEIEELPLAPRKSDIEVSNFGVVWLPWHVDSTGIAARAY